MRVVVTGATGNVGTSVVERLGRDSSMSTIGVSRRAPRWRPGTIEWVEADVATADLANIFDGADAVVHLAWLIQPSRDVRAMWATNVAGTQRVVTAVARVGVPTLIAASSIGAYSPAPAGQVVDETWPTDGVPESSYSWQKSLAERMYDVLASSRPDCRVVRVRPALIFKRSAARHVQTLFFGPLLPRPLLRRGPALRLVCRSPIPFQVVHSDDVADAIHGCLTRDVSGAFNLAAPGVIGHASPTSRPLVRLGRVAVAAAWRARLVPIDPGWLSLAEGAPLMSTERAEALLDWRPTRDARDVVGELLDGLRTNASFPTPPLSERRLDSDVAVRQPSMTVPSLFQ